MEAKIAVLGGDGDGHEILDATMACLQAVAVRFGHQFNFVSALLGGEAIDNTGVPLPQETLELCKNVNAVLIGSVGGAKWNALPGHLRPEKGLQGLRSDLDLYSRILTVVINDELKYASPLKNELLKQGVDFILVREVNGGIYFGERGRRVTERGQEAFDTEKYCVDEIERVAMTAFELAMSRKKRLISVDKSNMLDTGRLWRATVEHVGKKFPEVSLEHMYVDKCASQIIKDPTQFDVILCPNMFGDILSDEASAIVGAVRTLPLASLGATKLGLYGSANLEEQNSASDTANPIGAILSAAMLLSNSLELYNEAYVVQKAVQKVLSSGYRTPDIHTSGYKKVGCSKIAELIAMQILTM